METITQTSHQSATRPVPINFELAFRVDVLHLYNGHRSFYAALTFFGKTLWLQRWDVERAPSSRFLSSDGLMGWTWGAR